MEIRPVALEDLVRLDVDVDVEISVRAAALAGFTEPLEPDARSFVDACRHFHFDLLQLVASTRALARLARRRDDAARAAALEACAGRHELPERCLSYGAHLTLTVTFRTSRRRMTVGRSAAAARVAASETRKLDLTGRAAQDLFERDLDVVAKVGTARRSAAAFAARARCTEEQIED